MEYNNKAKTKGMKQQQTHRTQEWTTVTKGKGTGEDGWEGRDKGEKGALQLAHIMWVKGAQGR